MKRKTPIITGALIAAGLTLAGCGPSFKSELPPPSKEVIQRLVTHEMESEPHENLGYDDVKIKVSEPGCKRTQETVYVCGFDYEGKVRRREKAYKGTSSEIMPIAGKNITKEFEMKKGAWAIKYGK